VADVLGVIKSVSILAALAAASEALVAALVSLVAALVSLVLALVAAVDAVVALPLAEEAEVAA